MPIRILIAGLPRMLGEIVTAMLDKQDDFAVVQLEIQTDLAALVENAEADVVILGSGRDGETPAAVDRILRERPSLKLFTITRNGRDAFRVELRPQSLPIKEVSPRRLVDAIRGAFAETSPPDPENRRP